MKNKITGEFSYVFGIDICHKSAQLFISSGWYSAKNIFEAYTFAYDGTPVGVKVKDDDTDTE